MSKFARFVILGAFCAALAACATAQPQAVEPPPQKRFDAKTELESGKRPPRR